MDESFVALFRERSLKKQQDYYQKTAHEFLSASKQARLATTWLLVSAAMASSLQSIGIPWLANLATILALLCSLLSQSLGAYCALYAFEAQAQLYTEVADQLEALDQLPDGEELIEKVEEALARELHLWQQKIISAPTNHER